MSAHEMYRFYAKSGTLLYVGITESAERRISEHRRDKPWWQSVAAITIERFPDRSTAAQAEVTAIQQERPRYNKTHSLTNRDRVFGRGHTNPWPDASRFGTDMDGPEITEPDQDVRVERGVRRHCPACLAFAMYRMTDQRWNPVDDKVSCYVCERTWTEGELAAMRSTFDAGA